MGAFADVPFGRNMGPSVPDSGSSNNQGRPRYELLRVVNRGGMGEIALGKAVGTKGFEKLVVLKRLRADAEREDHLAMFDVEQEVMSRLEHPNIVKVFDQPVVDGVPYMAMEYVRGRNLDQVVRAANQAGEALPVQYCLSVVSEVLRGLAFVHRLKDTEGRALGVVHQDMTPSNVMVSFFGEVKITDFGISYVTSRDGGLRRGVLKGKPRYVAPEVLAGKRVNNTADIYGVGVVLFEMLTGRALFARPSVKETLSAVARNELPNLADELSEHSPGLITILEKTLKKAPLDRYRTAEEMATHVLNELAKIGGPMPPANLGFLTRKYFPNDPDVPEMDPALAKAISTGSATRPDLEPKDLESTLLELDKLLGKDDSIDLFSVPDELMPELREMPDMDPFQAHTPLPDFTWDAQSEAEILRKAGLDVRGATEEEILDGPRGLTKKDSVPPLPEDFSRPAVARPSPSDTPPGLIGPARPAPGRHSVDPLSPPPRSPPGRSPQPQPIDEAPGPSSEPSPHLGRSETTQPTVDTATPDTTEASLRPTRPVQQLQTQSSEPTVIVQEASSSGLLVGFVMGLAVGLAIGAMLYAALTG